MFTWGTLTYFEIAMTS